MRPDPRHHRNPTFDEEDELLNHPPRNNKGNNKQPPPKSSSHRDKRTMKRKKNWVWEILLFVPEKFCNIYRTEYKLKSPTYKTRAFWTLVQTPILLVSLEGIYLTTMNAPKLAGAIYQGNETEIVWDENELLNQELRFLPKPWGDDGAQLRRLAPNGQLEGTLEKFRDLNFATDLIGAGIDSVPIVNTLTRVDPEYENQTVFDNWDRFLIAIIASVAIQRVQGMFVRKMSRDVLAKRVASYNSATKVEAKDDAIWAAKPAAVSHNSYGIGEFIIPMMVVGLAYSIEIGTSLAMVRGLGLSSMGKLILLLGNCFGFEVSERIREDTDIDG